MGVDLTSLAFSWLENLPFMEDTIHLPRLISTLFTLVISEYVFLDTLSFDDKSKDLSSNSPLFSDNPSSESGSSTSSSEDSYVSTEELRRQSSRALSHEGNVRVQADNAGVNLIQADTALEEGSIGEDEYREIRDKFTELENMADEAAKESIRTKRLYEARCAEEDDVDGSDREDTDGEDSDGEDSDDK